MGAGIQSSSRLNKSASRRGGSYRPMSEINVTPFVDVMLVLLVVFMVTAPLLTAGVKIDLPQTQAKQISEEDTKPIEISVTAAGEIYIGESSVKKPQLIDLLSAMTRNDAERRIFVRADQGLSYGEVMDILGRLNKAGFSKVALISEQSLK